MSLSMIDPTGFIWQAYPARVTSWVCSWTLTVWWARSKGIPQKETGNAQVPGLIPPALPVSQRLSREKGDMSSFESVHLPLSFSHRVRETPALWPLEECTFSHETARDYSASKKVAGSKMSNPFKAPEGQWLDRSLQKRILPSLQINKWTWTTWCCL